MKKDDLIGWILGTAIIACIFAVFITPIYFIDQASKKERMERTRFCMTLDPTATYNSYSDFCLEEQGIKLVPVHYFEE